MKSLLITELNCLSDMTITRQYSDYDILLICVGYTMKFNVRMKIALHHRSNLKRHILEIHRNALHSTGDLWCGSDCGFSSTFSTACAYFLGAA